MILLQACAWNSVRMLNWLSVPCMQSVHDHDNSLVRHASHLRVGALALRDQERCRSIPSANSYVTTVQMLSQWLDSSQLCPGHSWLTALAALCICYQPSILMRPCLINVRHHVYGLSAAYTIANSSGDGTQKNLRSVCQRPCVAPGHASGEIPGCQRPHKAAVTLCSKRLALNRADASARYSQAKFLSVHLRRKFAIGFMPCTELSYIHARAGI